MRATGRRESDAAAVRITAHPPSWERATKGLGGRDDSNGAAVHGERSGRVAAPWCPNVYMRRSDRKTLIDGSSAIGDGQMRGVYPTRARRRTGTVILHRARGLTLLWTRFVALGLSLSPSLYRVTVDRQRPAAGRRTATARPSTFWGDRGPSVGTVVVDGPSPRRGFARTCDHRLAVLTLHLPPLRERRRTRVLLGEHFLAARLRRLQLGASRP
jgi:hypothetical protein